MSKRVFDVIVAALGLLAVSPVLAVAALLVKLDSPGPVLFRQERIGRRFEPFTILKLRTMRTEPGLTITAGTDARITRVGAVLRKSKIDELPQLVNVLRGDMSLVGPRPETRDHVELFRDDFAVILRIRPGITDPASIEYRRESDLLAGSADPRRMYLEEVLPAKLALAKRYVENRTFAGDLVIIWKTLIHLYR